MNDRTTNVSGGKPPAARCGLRASRAALCAAVLTAAGCVSLPPSRPEARERTTVLDAARRFSSPAPAEPQSVTARRRSPGGPAAPAGAPRAPAPVPHGAPPPVRRAPPPRGATAYATSAGRDHTMRTPGLVVLVTDEGRLAAQGRFLDPHGLETRLRALARERPDAVVIVRPIPGAPDWRVRDVAALCDRVGLHCLPFPAH